MELRDLDPVVIGHKGNRPNPPVFLRNGPSSDPIFFFMKQQLASFPSVRKVNPAQSYKGKYMACRSGS